MIICGIKITHDGGIAVIEDGQLKFSIEMEKINNNHRYSGIKHIDVIPEILKTNGYSLDSIDQFVIDGWHGQGQHWRGDSKVFCNAEEGEISLTVGGYNETNLGQDILERKVFKDCLPIAGKTFSYSTYMHVTAHILGTYCASPFAAKQENSYVLAWDGGQYPRLYYVDARQKKIINKGHLFFLLGTAYSIIGQYFGPYKKTEEELEADRKKMELIGFFGGYSIAGKIMSYMGAGEVKTDLLQELPKIYKNELEISNQFEHKFCRAIVEHVKDKSYSDADVLLTFHTFLQDQLLQGLKKKITKDGLPASNFCFCGGSALNIKWNSAIRASGLFKDVFVAPYPNDSGSALGAAVCEMWTQTKHNHMEWSAFSGPVVLKNTPIDGWTTSACSVKELAQLLHETGEPIVALNSRAAIGPRALGHRSILAPPTSKRMQAILNAIKGRESFRPVAPICLASEAPSIFSLGGTDPYMLFDHKVRAAWVDKIPAICHVDGTARLQTVSEDQQFMFELLTEYYALTGVPLLCNTSANLNGSGFFYDVKSVTEWGKVNYVWCEGTLYTKEKKNEF